MPKTKEERLADIREWKRNNPDKVKAQVQRYQKKHSQEVNEKNRNWRAANVDVEKKRARNTEYYEKHKVDLKLKRLGLYVEPVKNFHVPPNHFTAY